MVWLQDRVLNTENGSEEWTKVVTWLNTPPAVAARPVAVAAGPVPVLPPSQHAASFAAFAGFTGRG